MYVFKIGLAAEAYGTGQTVLLGAVRSHVPARPAARQIFSYLMWELLAGGE